MDDTHWGGPKPRKLPKATDPRDARITELEAQRDEAREEVARLQALLRKAVAGDAVNALECEYHYPDEELAAECPICALVREAAKQEVGA